MTCLRALRFSPIVRARVCVLCQCQPNPGNCKGNTKEIDSLFLLLNLDQEGGWEEKRLISISQAPLFLIGQTRTQKFHKNGGNNSREVVKDRKGEREEYRAGIDKREGAFECRL